MITMIYVLNKEPTTSRLVYCNCNLINEKTKCGNEQIIGSTDSLKH
jgi:hypothetical protein